MKTLKVKAIPGKLQPDFDSFDAGIKRYVGCKYDKENNMFVQLELGQEIPARAEYVRAVKEGALLPMDKETADYCGVDFHVDLYVNEE